jgi:hypothetical protein
MPSGFALLLSTARGAGARTAREWDDPSYTKDCLQALRGAQGEPESLAELAIYMRCFFPCSKYSVDNNNCECGKMCIIAQAITVPMQLDM